MTFLFQISYLRAYRNALLQVMLASSFLMVNAALDMRHLWQTGHKAGAAVTFLCVIVWNLLILRAWRQRRHPEPDGDLLYVQHNTPAPKETP